MAIVSLRPATSDEAPWAQARAPDPSSSNKHGRNGIILSGSYTTEFSRCWKTVVTHRTISDPAVIMKRHISNSVKSLTSHLHPIIPPPHTHTHLEGGLEQLEHAAAHQAAPRQTADTSNSLNQAEISKLFETPPESAAALQMQEVVSLVEPPRQ